MNVKQHTIPKALRGRSGVSAERRTTEKRGDGRTLPGRRYAGFTLVEMLVVIAVIGIVAGISVPALKNMQKSDAEAAATRQLVDEISNARQRAISQRSDVYLVFIPPVENPVGVEANYFSLLSTQQDRQQATNLLGSQFIGYGFFSERSVGDQPGQSHPRYHGEWRQLPEGTFIAQDKFLVDSPVSGVNRFGYRRFPFPLATSPDRYLPYIGFDYQGRMFHEDPATGQKLYGLDEVIPLARGAVSRPSGAAGTRLTASVDEKPPGNSITNYNHVRVNWLTGRASVEHP